MKNKKQKTSGPGEGPSIRYRIFRVLYQPYKWLIFIPLFILITLVMGSVSMLLASFFNAKIGMKYGGSVWAWLSCIVVPVFVRIRNKEHIIPGQSYVVVSNHQSQFDILVVVGWLNIDLRWVAKASLKKTPMFGPASVKMDHIFIDRSNTEAALETINKAKKNIVNGTSVMFFPEGTRSEDGSLQEFKNGAFKMALDLGIPVLPITIRGTRKILPSGSLDLLPGMAEIVIHPQIDTIPYSDESIKDLVHEARKVVESGLS